jgi:hypothetical protein
MRCATCALSIVAAGMLVGCETTTMQEARQENRFKATYTYAVPYQLAHKKLLEHLTIGSLVGRAFDEYDSRRIYHAIYCDLHCSTIYKQNYMAAELVVQYILDIQAEGQDRCRIGLSAASERDKSEIEAALRTTLGEPQKAEGPAR